MTRDKDSVNDPGNAGVYQIRIAGHLGPHWSDWLEGMEITLEGEGHTRLTGELSDQAALHGLLRKLANLGLQLVSVNRLEEGR